MNNLMEIAGDNNKNEVIQLSSTFTDHIRGNSQLSTLSNVYDPHARRGLMSPIALLKILVQTCCSALAKFCKLFLTTNFFPGENLHLTTI